MFPYITLVVLALLLVETQFCFTTQSDGSPGRVRVGRSRRRAESSGRRRRWVLRAAVVPCSLLLAEGLLQLLCLVSPRVDWLVAPTSRRGLLIPDTALGHRGNPSYFLEHDRRGYRNERAVAKADIAVLGDSQTYGDGASRANAWPQQLAALTGHSVYNMGMGGWGPVQYRAVLDDALALEPRVILVGLYFGNDLYDAYHMAYHSPSGADLRDPTVTVALRVLDREDPLEPTIRTLSHATLHAAPGLPPVDLATTASTAAGIEPSLPFWTHNSVRRVLSDHNALYGLARALWRQSLSPERPSNRSVPAWDDWTTWAAEDRPEYISAFEGPPARTVFTSPYRDLPMDLTDARIEEGLAVSLRVLAEIGRRCTAVDCRLLVVLIPTKETVFAPFVRSPDAHIHYAKLLRDETRVRRQVLAFLTDRRIAVTDAIPALRAALRTGTELIYPASADGHPRRGGYAAIARLVAGHPLLERSKTPLGAAHGLGGHPVSNRAADNGSRSIPAGLSMTAIYRHRSPDPAER